MTFFVGFFRDERTLTLAALIAADVIIGIIAALRSGQFSFQQVANFYRTNVVPFILGYMLVYAITVLGVASLLGSIWGEIAATVGAGPAVLNLVTSIARNLVAIRTPERRAQP